MLDDLRTIYPTIEAFNQMLKKYDLLHLGGYDQKDQKVGNCAWASSKAAFGVLCRQYTDHEKGRKIYKRFTEFCRDYSLHNYLMMLDITPSPSIIDKIKMKLSQKSGLIKSKQLVSGHFPSFFNKVLMTVLSCQ